MGLARHASTYLVIQGAAGLVWWVLLLIDSPMRDLFFDSPDGWLAGRTLVFAEVLMFGLVSIATGLLARIGHRWAAPAGWVVVGATAYATLVALGWLLEPVGHWLGVVLMMPTLAATLVSALAIHAEATEFGASAQADMT